MSTLRHISLFLVACLVTCTSSTVSGDEQKPHWAFQPLKPLPGGATIDTLIEAGLAGLPNKKLSASADRWALLRRLHFDLTGLPPTPAQLERFLRDRRPDAYDRLVDRLLASPAYGERMGKYWLDVAGYTDSNGYFSADTDRPYAYRYRDYVIQSFLKDKPFDQFVREQLAGDELAGQHIANGKVDGDRIRELMTATHFLRNAPDGSSESDGNPEEVIVDRATALNGSLQITMNSLLGITIQCARCHEHKFEPIEQAEYYQLQSIFYPVFPVFHTDKWVAPKSRLMTVASKDELAQWEQRNRAIDQSVERVRRDFSNWVRKNRPVEQQLFHDPFEGKVAEKWSNTVSGDDSPAGTPVINVDSRSAPAAFAENGALTILESGSAGDRWLATQKHFDWTPDKKGESIQVTFDLVLDRKPGDANPAARIAFCIALHDFNDNSKVEGGNLLIDGNPAGAAAVHLDYPGEDGKSLGSIGAAKYVSGRNYGIRITNKGKGEFLLQHVVDWVPEGKTLVLKEKDLPNGAFGFEYCCNRTFIVDNVVVERLNSEQSAPGKNWLQELAKQRKARDSAIAAAETSRPEKSGQIAVVTEVVQPTPKVYVRVRGEYGLQGEEVKPTGLEVLSTESSYPQPNAVTVPTNLGGTAASSGRRMAFANWLTKPGTTTSSLLARVIANRVWQQHFGQGIVATPDNFGLSGSEPTNAKLLDFLASSLIASNWSIKSLHRQIVLSRTYRQSSQPGTLADKDPDNLLLSHYPLRRLDAESIRDAMLNVSANESRRMFGPYSPTKRTPNGVILEDGLESSRRRSVYLQQRRTQVATFLELFDAPSIVSNCSDRTTSTVPLQSLAQLNSEFSRNRAVGTANRVLEARDSTSSRITFAYQLILGRTPNAMENEATLSFVTQQNQIYNNEHRVWIDICQALFASNAFLYLE